MSTSYEMTVFNRKAAALASKTLDFLNSTEKDSISFETLLKLRAWAKRANRHLAESRVQDHDTLALGGLGVYWIPEQQVYILAEPFGNELTWVDTEAEVITCIKRAAEDRKWLTQLCHGNDYLEAVHSMPMPSPQELARYYDLPTEKQGKKEVPKYKIDIKDLDLKL